MGVCLCVGFCGSSSSNPRSHASLLLHCTARQPAGAQAARAARAQLSSSRPKGHTAAGTHWGRLQVSEGEPGAAGGSSSPRQLLSSPAARRHRLPPDARHCPPVFLPVHCLACRRRPRLMAAADPDLQQQGAGQQAATAQAAAQARREDEERRRKTAEWMERIEKRSARPGFDKMKNMWPIFLAPVSAERQPLSIQGPVPQLLWEPTTRPPAQPLLSSPPPSSLPPTNAAHPAHRPGPQGQAQPEAEAGAAGGRRRCRPDLCPCTRARRQQRRDGRLRLGPAGLWPASTARSAAVPPACEPATFVLAGTEREKSALQCKRRACGHGGRGLRAGRLATGQGVKK